MSQWIKIGGIIGIIGCNIVKWPLYFCYNKIVKVKQDKHDEVEDNWFWDRAGQTADYLRSMDIQYWEN